MPNLPGLEKKWSWFCAIAIYQEAFFCCCLHKEVDSDKREKWIVYNLIIHLVVATAHTLKFEFCHHAASARRDI